MPGLSQPQLYHQTASSHKSSSSASYEEDAGESGPGEQIQQAVTLQWIHPSCPQSSVVYIYRGRKENEASHTNDGPSPLSIFLPYFAGIITLLVVETNCCYRNYIDLMMNPLLNLTLLKPKCLCFWH